MKYKRTSQDLVVASFSRHIRYLYELKADIFILFVKIFCQPLALLHISHCTLNSISSLEQLISNVTPDESIHTGDKNGGSWMEDDGGHSGGLVNEGK